MALYPTFTWFKDSGVGPLSMAYNENDATDSVVLDASEVLGAPGTAPAALVVVDLSGTIAAGETVTLPTVASLIAAAQLPTSGSFSYVLRILHSDSAAFDWTITTNTGWTLNGTMTVAESTYRDLLVTVDTDSNTATATNIGGGTA